MHEKKGAAIEARKLMFFGGAGGSGEACLSMVRKFTHARLPLRGCGESYGLRPLPPAPDHCSLFQDCRFLAVLQADLGIFGTQTCHLAGMVASLWRLGGTLGRFGTLGSITKESLRSRPRFLQILNGFWWGQLGRSWVDPGTLGTTRQDTVRSRLGFY